MKLGEIVLLVYAVLLIAGGLLGYLKASSLPSLIAGSASGVAVLACFLFALRNAPVAYIAGATVALLMVATFAWRLAKTGKFMPAGAMLILSILVLVLLVVARIREGVSEG
jgi:uncharacterized membrane protein (UPF0136 family)